MNDFLIDRCGRAERHHPHKYGRLIDGSIRHPLYCDGGQLDEAAADE